MRTRGAGRRGFSLIELLVVVIIIGILTAIAIPVYDAQRDKARRLRSSPAPTSWWSTSPRA